MSDERKTDPTGLVPPSLPPGYYAVPAEVLEYIMGRLRAIDAALFMLATKEDLDGFVDRVEALETNLAKQVTVCHYHHGNGTGSKFPEAHE